MSSLWSRLKLKWQSWSLICKEPDGMGSWWFTTHNSVGISVVAYICTVHAVGSYRTSICICVCIALWIQADKSQELCHPWFTWIWPELESSVKCYLSLQCFAPCSEQKDIYWAAHSTALISDHHLCPPPRVRVIIAASLTADIFCSIISSVSFFLFLSFSP